MQYKENLSAPVTHSQALNLLWAVLSRGLITGESKLSYCSCGATLPSDPPPATLCNLWLLQQVCLSKGWHHGVLPCHGSQPLLQGAVGKGGLDDPMVFVPPPTLMSSAVGGFRACSKDPCLETGLGIWDWVTLGHAEALLRQRVRGETELSEKLQPGK